MQNNWIPIEERTPTEYESHYPMWVTIDGIIRTVELAYYYYVPAAIDGEYDDQSRFYIDRWPQIYYLEDVIAWKPIVEPDPFGQMQH